jgi:hypothetical protein
MVWPELAVIHLPRGVGGRTATRLSQEVTFEGDLRRCVTVYRLIRPASRYVVVVVSFCVFCRI